jgi:divalent metal cation (Fe/Co/Zn/Cd) transporter
MPLLGSTKRRLARQTGIQSLSADAAQSNVCAWLSWISLVALGVNRISHLPWADSVGSLALLPLILHEANEARRGNVCDCS